MAREPLSRGDGLLLVVLFTLAGVADAAYLTWQWYDAGDSSWCDVGNYFSCTTVRKSVYASLAGVPTAAFGLAGFVLLLLFAVLALRGVEVVGPWSTDRWLLAFASLGALMGLGLTVLEIFVIQAVCLLCVIGFVVELAILYLVAVPLRRT